MTSIGQHGGDEIVEHPVVFLCMNTLGGVWLFFGIDLLRKGLTGDSRTSEESVLMTSIPDFVSGIMLTALGGCFCLGSVIWI